MVANSYRAWIPSITGKLSFSQIGRLCPAPVDYVTSGYDQDGCRVKCLQDRTIISSDSIFCWKGWLNSKIGTKLVYELDGFARFKGSTAPTLFGTIRCHSIGALDGQKISSGELFDNSGLFTIRFILRRSGYVRLFGFESTENLEDGDQLSEADRYYLYAQSYMFLKDMVHRHRHHNPSDDTFVEMQKSISGWKDRIAFQLMKRVIRRPIKGDPVSFQEAIGVIDYLTAFQTSLKVSVYTPTHLSAMKSSFSAEYSKSKDKISDMRWTYGVFVGLITFWSRRFVDWDAVKKGPEHIFVPMALVLIALYFLNKTRVFRYDENPFFLDLVSLITASIYTRIVTLGLVLVGLASIYFVWGTTPLASGLGLFGK